MSTGTRSRWWWLAVLFGVAAAVLGAVLIFRPFTSLSVLIAFVAAGFAFTGVTALSHALHRDHAAVDVVAGVGWIAGGVVVVAWPGITIGALALVVAVAVVVGGVLDVVAAWRATTDERWAAAIGGVASVVFGVLAFVWPDITILVVAVVFGARLVLYGLRTAWSAGRGRASPPGEGPAGRPRPRLRRGGHVVGTIAILVLALVLAGLSAKILEGEPVVSAFYNPPADVPGAPGALIRWEPFTRAIPAGATAWRILYTTTRAEGVPAVASGIVVVPAGANGPVPVIAWAHGTTGVDRRCAPSLLPDPWTAGAFYSTDQVLEQGWALVATDYVGLGSPSPHPYLVGEPEGRSVLDAVRAARQLPGIQLSNQTVVWGHSQGGGAALWTGIIAPSYAPDVPLAGVAALAPASDLVALMDRLDQVRGGSIFASYVLDGYAATYPDVRTNEYLRPIGQVTYDAVIGRCLNATAIVSAVSSIATGMTGFQNLDQGALRPRLQENVPTGPIQAPLFVAQGDADGLVLASVQAAYVQARCAAGEHLEYRTYPGRDHVPLMEPDSPALPDLFAWTKARLAGAAPTPTC